MSLRRRKRENNVARSLYLGLLFCVDFTRQSARQIPVAARMINNDAVFRVIALSYGLTTKWVVKSFLPCPRSLFGCIVND